MNKPIFRPYPGPLAIYLHFPFCRNLCHYCDFYKEPFNEYLQTAFFRALRMETEMVLSAFEQEPIEVSSIYIGGGTPSLCDPVLLKEWVAEITAYCRFSPDFEFTIEANPESLTAKFAYEARDAGINRVVIGVQSFDKKALTKVGRRQKIKDIYQAFYNARLTGFENIAADLIFGLPGQTIKKLRTDIDRLMALEPKHISFYQLTVEPDTILEANIDSGKVHVPDDDTCAEMYKLGSHILQDKKYTRYEISNFALEGFQSRHNRRYWTGQPYIAFGPAGHGFVNNWRYHNVGDVNEYIATIESGLLPIVFREELTAEDRLNEAILLSLRTSQGIDKEKLIRQFGEPALTVLESQTVAGFIRQGYLKQESGVLTLTDNGFLVADKIICDLVSQSST